MAESAHQFPEVHAALGIDLSKLGCIMADVDRIPVLDIMQTVHPHPAGDLYESAHPDRFWIRGAVGEQGAHVTLLYGLLQPGPVWREHVDALLATVQLDTVRISHVDLFDSPYPDEAYKCVVAHLELTPPLSLAHARLSYLPHVNTFPGYRAHVTLAYVKDGPALDVDWARTIPEVWVRTLNERLAGRELAVTGIDYGGRP